MKIIFFGTPDFVVPVLESLLKQHDIIAVVTAPDRFDGKKNKTIPSPVKAFYRHYYETHSDLNERHPLQIFTPEKLSTINFHLSTLQPDLFIVAAYGKIIPRAILDIPSLGALNVHPSLLPKYRGPAPVPAAILNGDTVTGVSIIKMDEKMDHGPILASESEGILETDTFETLVKRLFEKSATMLPEVIKNYADGNITLVPQDETQATYVKMMQKDDGYIELLPPLVKAAGGFKSQNEEMENGKWLVSEKVKMENLRKIRAYYPWPGVWTTVRIKNHESRIKLLPYTSLRGESSMNDSALLSGLAHKPFLIQMEGKKPMTVKDFLNGYPELREQIQQLS